jgi:hypothetical protein
MRPATSFTCRHRRDDGTVKAVGGNEGLRGKRPETRAARIIRRLCLTLTAIENSKPLDPRMRGDDEQR